MGFTPLTCPNCGKPTFDGLLRLPNGELRCRVCRDNVHRGKKVSKGLAVPTNCHFIFKEE